MLYKGKLLKNVNKSQIHNSYNVVIQVHHQGKYCVHIIDLHSYVSLCIHILSQIHIIHIYIHSNLYVSPFHLEHCSKFGQKAFAILTFLLETTCNENVINEHCQNSELINYDSTLSQCAVAAHTSVCLLACCCCKELKFIRFAFVVVDKSLSTS